MKTNENNFIKRLQRDKEEALEWVYDRYVPLVKTVVQKVLSRFNDYGMIEECINDVFIAVWKNSKSFVGDEKKFRNWICSIARFKAIDYYRKIVKKSEDILDEVDIIEKDTIEDEIVLAENKKELELLLNSLDEVDRKIFIMKYFLGFKSEEISEELNLTKASINCRIYRNKKKLKINAVKLGLEVI